MFSYYQEIEICIICIVIRPSINKESTNIIRKLADRLLVNTNFGTLFPFIFFFTFFLKQSVIPSAHFKKKFLKKSLYLIK
ncbi:hypothetical protein Glove_502g20 [Diversispora epigaea]|uniref:Uncharacterized protein n=1 Tax=Diversispora epigaea TaxID=1348612 RepID=A0A397GML2_9GLOM|nr:hypothetical protein Glove_502g20 [Diversispora epigaea]